MTRWFGAGACALGWLCLAACGGKSRFEVASHGAEGGAPSGVGGSAGTTTSETAGAAGERETWGRLEQILDDGPWAVEQQTTGIAVDSGGNIYVSDGGSVYQVIGNEVSEYLTRADILAGGVGEHGPRIYDLDIGSDDRLIIAVSGYVVNTNGPHAISVLHQLTEGDEVPVKMGAIASPDVLVVSPSGLTRYGSGSPKFLYDAEQLQRTAGCAAEDLAVSGTGEFLYQPGCNRSPLMRGRADGSGVGVLYEAGTQSKVPISASNFVCSTRDLSGGFYVVTRNAAGLLPLLYHVDQNASSMDAATYLPTEPSLAAMQNEEWSDPLAFYFCSIAVAPDGSIVFQTFRQLWRITPNPP